MSSNAFTPRTLVPSWAIAASTCPRIKSLALAAFPDALERIFSLMVLGASKALFTAYYVLPVDYQPMDFLSVNQRRRVGVPTWTSATNADAGGSRALVDLKTSNIFKLRL